MKIITIVFIIIIAVIAIDGRQLLKLKAQKGSKKELWVFLILFLFSIGIVIAEGLDVKIPNPADWIAFILKPFSNFLFNLLK
ncbi:hypothetical protein FZC66_09010 [Priestia megaterium]|nr:hypothetical protein FZC66_09010 [Priestia megaterium]